MTDKFKFALDEWFQKTDWIAGKAFPFQYLGMHRADVMKKYIEHLEADLRETERLAGNELAEHAEKLKAERQRADYAVKVKDNDEQTALYWAKIAAEALAEIAALKAKLANPVVLPAKLPDEGYGGEAVRNWWRNKTVTDCARRIAEAGFTVKGE